MHNYRNFKKNRENSKNKRALKFKFKFKITHFILDIKQISEEKATIKIKY